MLCWNDRLVDWQKAPLCPTQIQMHSKVILQQIWGKASILLLSCDVMSPDSTSAVTYSTSWLGWVCGFKVGGNEGSMSDRKSFTVSSVLTSPLSSPPCTSSSACLESSVLQTPSMPTAHISLLSLPYALCVTRFNQSVYIWSSVVNKSDVLS